MIFALILLVIVYYVVGSHLLKQEISVSQDQAAGFALDELRYTYPGASVDMVSISNATVEGGVSTWKIMARVVYGNNTICPNLTEVELHYPKFGFVTRERIITDSCQVLGCRNVPNCIIAYPEEAVLMPLDTTRNPNRDAVLGYVNAAGGSPNVQAHATYSASYGGQGNRTYSDVWVVAYSSASLNYSMEVVLNKTGGVVVEQYAKGPS